MEESLSDNKLKLFSGTLTVNVSVLLLSLASPDESSLVSSLLRGIALNFP